MIDSALPAVRAPRINEVPSQAGSGHCVERQLQPLQRGAADVRDEASQSLFHILGAIAEQQHSGQHQWVLDVLVEVEDPNFQDHPEAIMTCLIEESR